MQSHNRYFIRLFYLSANYFILHLPNNNQYLVTSLAALDKRRGIKRIGPQDHPGSIHDDDLSLGIVIKLRVPNVGNIGPLAALDDAPHAN